MTAAQNVDGERAAFLGWALESFPRFCGLLDIKTKQRTKEKLRLNRIQKRFNRERTGRDICLKARQIGFSTLELARDVFFFLKNKGVNVTVVCQSMTDNTPLNTLSAIVRLYFDSLRRIGIALEFTVEKGHEWQLGDSVFRIIVAGASELAASKVGRSGTIHRLHITEQAFFEYADETMNALLECVPAPEMGSEIVIESTPNGAAGLFYRQCEDARLGRNSYKFHFYPWFEMEEYRTPLAEGESVQPETEKERTLVDEHHVTPEQLKWYRRKLRDDKNGDQSKMDQEYPSDPQTCFLVSGRCFFDLARINSLIESAGKPIEKRDRDRVIIWKRPVRGHRYVVAVDTAEGGGGDDSAGIVYDVETSEHVATVYGQYPPKDLAKAAAALGREYSDGRPTEPVIAMIAVERNNHGHAVLLALVEIEKYANLYTAEDQKLGWVTSPVTRPVMLDEFEAAHRTGVFKTSDRILLGQMRTFVVPPNGKPQAQNGEKDDAVLGAAIGWFVRSRPMPDFRVGGASGRGW